MKKETDKRIGERIKFRRKELGLTQLQIKQDVGISSGNLSDFENGNKLPSASTLIALSKALNCSIDWLLTGESFVPQTNSLINENVERLLEGFQNLSADNQEEIIEIVELKLKRAQRKGRNR